MRSSFRGLCWIQLPIQAALLLGAGALGWWLRQQQTPPQVLISPAAPTETPAALPPTPDLDTHLRTIREQSERVQSILIAREQHDLVADVSKIMHATEQIADLLSAGSAIAPAPPDQRAPTSRPELHSPTSAPVDQPTILVIEDDLVTRTMVQRVFECEGWMVVAAAHGREALEAMATVVPQVILLDLIMPEMDGFAFLAALRAQPAWAHIPLIVVSAHELSTAEQALLQHYTAQVLKKGTYGKAALVALVRRMLAL
jgi:CheY-like chemotaxis protein